MRMDMLLALAAVLLLLWAAATDVISRRIPNPLSLALAGAGAARILADLLAAPGSAMALVALTDLWIALVVFAVGAGLFALGWFGGGDVKLLAAGTLWLGAAQAGAFLYLPVLAGGVLALAFHGRRAAVRIRGAGGGPAPEVSLPYGVAIAAGGILLTTGLV
jgi:prepilin peptidase CpaA